MRPFLVNLSKPESEPVSPPPLLPRDGIGYSVRIPGQITITSQRDMAESKVAGFQVFLFLKGKNMSVRSEKQLKAQLQVQWESLSEEERGKYQRIAVECLSPADSDTADESEASSRLLKLKQAIRRSLLSCSRFLRSLTEGQLHPLLCPVNLPHEDILVCPVCSHGYNLGIRTPVCLPCGHTLCGDCLRVMSERGAVLCPFDRSPVERQTGALRPNLSLCEAVSKVSDWAQCKKHGVQVVAFCEKEEKVLCGFCLEDYAEKQVVDLGSLEAAKIGEEKEKRSMENLTETNFLLQSMCMENNQLSAHLESLTQKCVPAASQYSEANKQLARKLAKLRSSLCACVKALQTAMMRDFQQVFTAGNLPSWQRLTQPMYEAPTNPPMIEDALSCLEAWLAYI